MLIVLHRNGSYNDMIASAIKSGGLICDSNDLFISYMMNGRGIFHAVFIKNDRHVEFYILCVNFDDAKPILRIEVVERSEKEASTSSPPSASTSTPIPCSG